MLALFTALALRAASLPATLSAAAPTVTDPSADSDEVERPSVSVDADQLGRVTYAGARVDVPVSKVLSFFPDFEILRVGPAFAGDETIVRPFFGGGVGLRPADTWSIETGLVYGPLSFDIESIEGALAVTKEFGADWSVDRPPLVELQFELGVGRFRWGDKKGPAGETVVQSFLASKLLWRANRRWELTPQAMVFVYDKPLDQAVGDRLGSAMVLARVGAFAPPRALFGGRASYRVWKGIAPLIEANEILYASGSGDATELLGGVRVAGSSVGVTLAGGVLLNRTGGPLVPTEYTNLSLPLARLEFELRF